ncbi:MAG: thioredoxin domain-containing protein, partial [Methylocystis sp.]
MLQTIAEMWRNHANAIEHNVKELSAGLAHLSETAPEESISPDLVETVCEELERRLDRVDGGFGAAPKFPQATSLDFLWRAWKRTGRDSCRQGVVLTLDHISQGGVYDHLGGGFARYSTDDRWLVPHFEKMLYDNAQLIDLLTEVWQDERRELYRLRVTETIQWIAREMRTPGGGFASSLDADSESEEGKFYSWNETEIHEALGERATFFERAYGVDHIGNWEHGKSILNRLGSIQLLDEETEAALAQDRSALFSLRERRVRPGRDDKVLADWNGLTIAAIAKAACVFERGDWLDVAIEAFEFVKGAMTTDDDRLLHSWREGRA